MPKKAEAKKRTVMVAVDLTDLSDEVLALAVEWAEVKQAGLHVLHVVHDPADAPGFYLKHQKRKTKKLRASMLEAAEEMMAKFMARAEKRWPASKTIKRAQTEIVTGTPTNRILEVAETVGPEMIVMGSAGRRGAARMFVGSHAERVATMAKCPVTIVKAKA